jgi:hypothetical protein
MMKKRWRIEGEDEALYLFLHDEGFPQETATSSVFVCERWERAKEDNRMRQDHSLSNVSTPWVSEQV